MKIKKIIALLASAAIAASMAVPVMAAETTIEASSGAWFRLKDNFNAWNNSDSYLSIGSTKAESTTTKEVQGNARFGAIYEFDMGSDYNSFTSISLTVNLTANNSNYPLGVYIYDNAVPTEDGYADLASYYNNSDASAYTAPTAIATQTGTGTKTITFDETALESLKTAAESNNGVVRLLLSSSPIRATENKQIKIDIDGPSRPALIVDKPVEVAQVGDNTYYTFEDAVTNVADGGTITLLNNVTMASRQILEKSITIDGNSKTITGPSGQFAFELKQGSGITLNLSNVTINALDGKDAVATKNNTLIASNTTLSKLSAGGKYSTTAATLTDCTVTDITTYGKIELAGTTTVTGTITLPNINTSGADQPKFVLGENASVTATLTVDSENIPEGYTLVEGAVDNFTSTFNNGTYELVDGVFVVAGGSTIPANAVASATIDGTINYYEDLPSAIEAVAEKETITLLKDVELASPIYLAKSIVINGDNHTITAADGAALAIEVTSWYSLTLNNTAVEGGSSFSIDVKGSASLTAENSTLGSSSDVSGLRVCGNATATVKNSAVNNAQLYGKLVATEGSTVNNVKILAINPNGADKPEVNLDDTSSAAGTLTLADGVSPVEGYTFVTGTVANFAPTYDDGTYVLENGVFVKKVIPEVITMTPSFVGAYEGDTDGSVAVAYTASFTSTTGATASLNVGEITWKLDDATLTVADDNATTNVTVTLSDDASVVYGIIISGVAAEGTLTADFN